MESVPENGLDEQRAKVFARQIIQGLAECSARDIIHRDLKPENIFCVGEAVQGKKAFGWIGPLSDDTVRSASPKELSPVSGSSLPNEELL